MTRTSPPQVSFSSGEIDPLLYRRFDYQRFQTGLAACRGFIPLAQGGFTRAPGTLHKGNTLTNGQGILLPFTFAVNDSLTLEFTHLKMRVWRYGALVLSAGVPYELTTPYPLSSLAGLQWVQSADVIYLADGTQPIQVLSRFALDNWTIAPLVLNTGPFRVQNLTKTLTVQASAATGTITLTASSALFAANHIGSLMELRPTDNSTVALWTSNEIGLSVGNIRRYGRNVYELTAGTNSGTNPPIHEEGEELVDNKPTKWLFLSTDTGIVRITAIGGGGTTATATVLQRIPKACVDTPTYRWSEGAWSARYGYPAALEIYDQRFAAAATPTEPRTLWFSTAGDFADFAPGTEADSAFAYAIPGNTTINRILNLQRGNNGLHIFALGEELSIRSEARGQLIGPTNISINTNSRYGSSPARPISPDGNPIFIDKARRRLIMMIYSLEADAARPTILSRASQHLGNDPFEQVVWQQSPEPMAWIRRASGDVALMIYDAAEEVLGWAVVPLAGGHCEALSVTPNADGTADEILMIVRRTIDGQTVRFVEQVAPIFGILGNGQPVTNACHHFASAEFSPGGSPTATFNIPHLANQQVHAWTDQGPFGPLSVGSDGVLVLPQPVGHAFIGLLDETHFVDTLDIQAAAPDGNTMARWKRMHAGWGVGLHNTAQGYVQLVERQLGQSDRVQQKRLLIQRPVAAPLAETGWSGIARLDEASGQAHQLAVRFSPFLGAPMTVTAFVPIVQEAGR